MFHSIKTTLFILLVSQTVCAQTQDGLSLNELIQEALDNNPQLHSARHQADAAKAQIKQVTSLDAPQVGIEFYQTPIQSFPIATKNSMETDYFVQQMFPWPGKLSGMGKIAENNVAMKEQESKALDKKIIRDLKSAYYELYLVQRKMEINGENKRIMQKIIDIALKQYEVGAGNQSDILRAQTELTKLTNESFLLEREKGITEAMINTLISRPANQPLGRIAELEIHDVKVGFDPLVAIAEDNRAELKAMGYNIEMFKSEQALAKREFYPDIMVRGMYKNMSNTSKDFWSLMIGFNVPIAFWSKNRYQGKVNEFGKHINHAEMEYRDTKNMIGNDIQNALVIMESSRKQADEIKRHLIPQAEATLEATLASYQSGKTSFIMALDSYRMLLMAKLDYSMSVMNTAVSEAQLEQAVGLSMNEIKERLK
ncbi:TolC family protein [bacterium]|nr:MAG: TolC family protein [bacterium]